MQRDERDLLEVLKAELEFLNHGGYARVPNSGWRPVYIFEDSPACMNHDYEADLGSCGDCVLLQLVPPEFRYGKHPCRHIPLNAGGETLDSLYRYGSEPEIEETVRTWLEATINGLEGHRKSAIHSDMAPTFREAGSRGIALREGAKCANPACPVAFDWRKGGKFFRFRESPQESASSSGVHGVKHFWLCERCAHLFTLAYEEHSGVVLRVSWPKPVAADDEHFSAVGRG